MDFKLLDPPLPTRAKWREMQRVAPGQSVLRALEYALIDELDFVGRVLDFGGGSKASYARFLEGADEVLSVNIDGEFAPSHVVEPGAPLPFLDDHFDMIATFNTLEHIYDDVAAIAELTRVLRPGGSLHIVVPFLFRVHGHPDDYNRHTPSWWAKTLEHQGYAKAQLQPLIFGRRTTAQMVTARGPKFVRSLRKASGALSDILSARILFAGKTHYTGRQGARVWSQAPGWYIHAEK